MPQTWEQIRDGYGLQEVPSEYKKELGCTMCSAEFPARGKLYTPEPIPPVTTVRDIQRLLNTLRGKCYCKTHARIMYGENV